MYDAVNNRTPDQEAIALFWSDDPGMTATPPGHSISVATQVLRLEDASLMLAAETCAKVGMAVCDAFIACWNTKYRYNLLRPVTYIHRLIDPTWLPLLNTPPFPEYTSGHSVQSAAAFGVLADLFGDSYSFDDHTHDNRGLAPRHLDSFGEPPRRRRCPGCTAASTSARRSSAGLRRDAASPRRSTRCPCGVARSGAVDASGRTR